MAHGCCVSIVNGAYYGISNCSSFLVLLEYSRMTIRSDGVLLSVYSIDLTGRPDASKAAE